MKDILQTALEISLPITIIIALLSVLRPLFSKRYHAKWMYWVWLCLALRLLVPFNLPKIQPALVLNVTDTVMYEAPVELLPTAPPTVLPPQNTTPNGEQITTQTPQEPTAQSPMPLIKQNILLSDLLYLVWVAGALTMLAIRVLCYFFAKTELLKNAKEEFPQGLEELTKELGIKRKIKVFRSSRIQTPILVGLFSPCIVMPVVKYSNEHTEMILRHELVHLKRWDILYKLLMMVVCCLYWFNPFVWQMSYISGIDIEISCDEEVVKGKAPQFKETYSESILQTVRNNMPSRLLLSTGFSGGKKTIKSRFDGIFKSGTKRTGKLALCLVLVCSISCGALVACNSNTPQTSAPQDDSVVTPVEPQPTELTDKMRVLIEIYEKYGKGDKFQSGNQDQNYKLKTLLIGYLEKNDLMQDYLDSHIGESGYYFDGTDIYETANFLVADGVTQDFFNNMQYLEFNPSPIETELEMTNSEILENGDYKFSFSRYFVDGEVKHVLNSAVYVLRKATATKVPNVLSSIFAEGDEYYQIVNVEIILTPPASAPKVVEIKTAEDLVNLSTDYNTNGWKYHSVTYKLANDIDMKGIDFTPIGLNATLVGTYNSNRYTDPRDNTFTGFNSVFDGNGFTISNLSVKYNENLTELQRSSVGLFGIIGRNGVVKNLTIKDANINGGGKNYWRYAQTGVLAGAIVGTAENCHVSGTVKGVVQVGGIAGYISGTYEEKDMAGNVIYEGKEAMISNCTANVNVRGSVYVGGFAGDVFATQIINSSSKGRVEAFESIDDAFSMGTPAGIGGFAGALNVSQLDNCNADTGLSFETDGKWFGAFAGAANGSTIKNSSYVKATAGNWRPIDSLEELAWRNDNPNYQITVK